MDISTNGLASDNNGRSECIVAILTEHAPWQTSVHSSLVHMTTISSRHSRIISSPSQTDQRNWTSIVLGELCWMKPDMQYFPDDSMTLDLWESSVFLEIHLHSAHERPNTGRPPIQHWLSLRTWERVICFKGCWNFVSIVSWLVVKSSTSLQYWRSYQDGHWLVTVRTHGDFIVQPHSEIRPPAPWPNIPLSPIILTWVNLSTPYPINVKHQARSDKYQFYKSFSWQLTGNWNPNLLHHDIMWFHGENTLS